jgi:hypothetical protein
MINRVFSLFHDKDAMWKELIEEPIDYGKHRQFVLGMINNICKSCYTMKNDFKGRKGGTKL